MSASHLYISIYVKNIGRVNVIALASSLPNALRYEWRAH